MKKIILITITAMLLIPLTAFAQENYTIHPGYVDFGDLTPFESGDKVTEINLENNLLKMVSKMAGDDDPELRDLLAGMEMIHVNSFQVESEKRNTLLQRINDIDKKLLDRDWNRIVKIRGTEENTNVYIKPNGDMIDGLVVTTLEPNGEAVFVNIVGNIDLATIGKLGNKFDIPSLDKIKKESKTGGN